MKTSRSCSDSALPGRPKHSVVLLVIVCALGVFVAPAAADATARNSALAASLTAGARDAMALGYGAEAVQLLDEALSWAPADADANYMRALAGSSAGQYPASVIPLLETALASNDFRVYSAYDARLLYASLLVRTHRFAEAMRMLSGLPRSAEYLYVEARAAFALGNTELSRADVLESLRRSPADPRPLLFWLQVVDRPYAQPADMRVVTASFAALESLKAVDASILVALAPYAPDIESSRLLVREFRATGGRSPQATVLALRYGLVDEARATAEMFSGGYVPRQNDIRELAGLLSSDDNRNRFKEACLGFSGMIWTDDDRDGFPESITRYEAGLPVGWVLDRDQDGRPEVDVAFASGEPRSAVAHVGSTTLTMSYAPWPHVNRVEFADSVGRRAYAMGPAVFASPIVRFAAMLENAGAPYLVRPDDAPLPTERGVAGQAYAVESHDAGGTSTAELYDGIPTQLWWRDAYGKSGNAVYNAGLPSDERIDIDGDGRTEARRVWGRAPDGTAQPLYIEVDFNGDGLYEYRETLVEPLLKAWDYDSDGAVDVTMRTMPDGRSLYSIMPGMGRGGVTTVLYRSGTLERVDENGVPLALVPDSGGRVLWIGTKPFDLGSGDVQEGYGSRDGVAYRIVAIGGRLYAQVIH